MKRRAFASVALHHDRPPMLLDDLCRNVEPHPKTRNRSFAWIKPSIEALKYFLALLLWDAHAMIAHPDGDGLYGSAHLHLDQRSIRRIRDGIAEQVDEDLFQTVFIPTQRARCRATYHDGMGRAHLLHGFGHLLEQRVQIDGLPGALQPARLDFGHIQQLSDQALHLL